MLINTTYFDFSRWRWSDILDFLKLEISTAGPVRRANMRHHAKVVPIGQTVAMISRSWDFSGWRPPPSRIFKFRIFNGRKDQEGWTALTCQILSKSLKPRPRYGDFSNFQNSGRRHLGFLKLQTSNCGTRHECRIASPCQISWRCRDIAIFGFFKMAARHLGFLKF